MRARLAVTVGDPRGIGPELVRAALADSRVSERCELLVVGPEGCAVPLEWRVGEWDGTGGAAEAGRLSGLAIERAVRLALDGEVQGVVTAPIDKSALHAGGYEFPGHTEMLAALTGTRVAMLLTATRPSGQGGVLRVILATTHLPLRDVPGALSRERIVEIAGIAREGLARWFGLGSPRIALCALNPHAGDKGRFGDEDDRILAPAASEAGLSGPHPADTVFLRALRGEFDAVIAPYHDIGMTAIKIAAFGSAVNVTLGLPFPRTAPDHGVALDIAGRGLADPSSFIAATLLCAELALRAASRADLPAYGDPPPASRFVARPSRQP